MEEITVAGKLIYNEEGQYKIGNFNFSRFLDYVYYSQRSNQIGIKILTDNYRIIFDKNSTIYRRKNDYGLYSYFVEGSDLETVLFDNTEKIVQITILSEVIVEAGDYEQFYCKEILC